MYCKIILNLFLDLFLPLYPENCYIIAHAQFAWLFAGLAPVDWLTDHVAVLSFPRRLIIINKKQFLEIKIACKTILQQVNKNKFV